LNAALDALGQAKTLIQSLLPETGPETQTGTVVSVKGQNTPFGVVGPYTTVIANTDGTYTTLYTQTALAVSQGQKYSYTFVMGEQFDTLVSATPVS
jgi:hypothetical protein